VTTSDGTVVIEFSKRNEAELAKSRGSYYQNEVLSISWKDEISSAKEPETGAVKSEW
jgi:hypothetical protein